MTVLFFQIYQYPDKTKTISKALPNSVLSSPVSDIKLVLFEKQSYRNKVFECRLYLDEEISIKPDLPKTVRVDNALMMKKKAELEALD